MYIGWCMYRVGIPGVYIGWYIASLVGYPPSVYLPICPPCMPTMVYTPVYTPYTPGYTQYTAGPLHRHQHARSVATMHSDEALGSEREKPVGRRGREALGI